MIISQDAGTCAALLVHTGLSLRVLSERESEPNDPCPTTSTANVFPCSGVGLHHGMYDCRAW